MEYFIAYNPSTDTLTVNDISSRRAFTEKGRILPSTVKTNSSAEVDTPHHLKTKPDVVEEAPASFLRIPLEVRLVIYMHCLVTPLQHAYNIHKLGHQLTLDLLLVNHQIYDEARLVPFQHNVFDFAKWNGTGLFYCQSFLRCLQVWQRVNVRNIKLDVLAVALACERGVERWLDLCGKLGRSERKDEGLKTLQLIISGCIMKCKETFDISAPWVACGLLKLHALQSLEVTVVDEGVNLDLLTTFISNVQRRLCEVKIALKTIARGKQSTLYFPVSLKAISRY
jgi:hypothetical protein